MVAFVLRTSGLKPVLEAVPGEAILGLRPNLLRGTCPPRDPGSEQRTRCGHRANWENTKPVGGESRV